VDLHQIEPGNMAGLSVAQLVESLALGGAENLAVQIANARAAAGDRAFLYVLTGPGILSEKVAPDVQVRYLGLDRAPIRQAWKFLGSLTGGLRRLRRQVRRDRVQVVQSHLPGANFWGLLLAEFRVCAVAATVHNTREFDFGDKDHPVRRRLRRVAYRRILRRCDATIAVSDEVRDCLLAELAFPIDQARRFEVVTNGVEVPAPLPTAEREAIRSRIGVPDGALLLLGAGRLTEQKDFANLVAAAGELRDQGRDFFLMIAGEGELRPDLQAQVADLDLGDRIALPGNRTDLRELMLAADLFVLPSRWEGLPLVLLEAMACGLPVVCTRLEGLQELVGRTGAGLMADPADSGQLAGAISRLLTETEFRRQCAGLARAVILKRYDFRRVSDQLGRLYAEIVAAGAS
jgi:glycosyltransferase involved in cell wall biosynthesis